MKIKKVITVLHSVSLCIFGAAMPSFAQDIGILLDNTTLGTSVVNGESVTSDGVTMTISGIVAADGGDTGEVDDWGILFGSDNSSSDVVSFGISFNVDVRITGYEIGAREDVPAGASFVITGSNGSSGPNPIPEFSGFTETEIYQPYEQGTLPVLKAGEVYTFTHNLSDFSEFDALFNLEALDVALVSSDMETQVEIENFTVDATEVSFSFLKPQNEYLVASSTDLMNWDLSRIFASSQSEVVYTAPRVSNTTASEFFVVYELPTTDKVHGGNFRFSLTVISAEDGQSYVQDSGAMQAGVVVSPGDTEVFTEAVSVDLNNLTIEFLGLSGELTPSGLGYSFEIRHDFPRKLEEEASDEVVQYYSENSEVFSGQYDLRTGTISIDFTEISRLTWNLTDDVSVATTIWSLLITED